MPKTQEIAFQEWIARVESEVSGDVSPEAYRRYYDQGLPPAEAVLQERTDSGVLDSDSAVNQVVFSAYYSDGPGYCGPIRFLVSGNAVVQTTFRDSGAVAVTVTLPDALPSVETVRDYHEDDASLIEANLQPEVREYLRGEGGLVSIDPERVKVLRFADGQSGFLIVHGEPCFFDLVCGQRRYSINEQSVEMY